MKLPCCVLILLMIGPLNVDRLMAQQRAVAIVVRISGTVILKHGANQIKLNPNSDLGRRLFPGDKVLCETKAKLTLRIGSRDTELDENSGWFEIPRMSARAEATQRAIDEYGRTGGRDKGIKSKSVFFQPVDEGFVVPEMFVIRWNPLRKNCSIKLQIQKPGGELLWHQDQIAGPAGVLNDETARSALSVYRNAADGALRLKLSSSCGINDQSSFTLLSIKDENALKSELQLWDNEPEKLIFHLGRAEIFARYRMLAEAANEYEGALTLAPRSRDLVLRTIEAHHRTGNLARVKALTKRLSQD